MRFNKQTLFLLFSLVFLLSILPFVLSVPPITTTQQFTEGYNIQIPQDNILQLGKDYEFDFHVFNISNGVPKTNGISCDFHLYNGVGTEIYAGTDSLASSTGAYSFNISKGNFTKPENYYYFVRCNSSTLGGFSESILKITMSGEELTDSKARIDTGLLALLVVFLITSIFIFTKFDNLLARVGMIGISYLLLMAITFVSWTMAVDFLSPISFTTEMFRILFFVFVIGFFPLVIGAFAWYVLMLFKIKEIQRLMNKGFSEDEAETRVKSERKSRRRR